jgi:hypothetical protein
VDEAFNFAELATTLSIIQAELMSAKNKAING